MIELELELANLMNKYLDEAQVQNQDGWEGIAAICDLVWEIRMEQAIQKNQQGEDGFRG